MPQYPLGLNVTVQGSTTPTPTVMDASNALTTQRGAPVAGVTFATTALAQTANQTLKTGPGRLGHVSVVSNSSTVGLGIYDQATSGTATAAQLILSIPGTVAVGTQYTLDGFPFVTGLTMISNTGTVSTIGISISYS